MTGFEVSATPPRAWAGACARESALFGCDAWQSLLERSFGCRTLYAWNGTAGAAISVFPAGPFRIGYATFPVGGTLGQLDDWQPVVDAIRRARRRGSPACLRIPASAFDSAPRCDFPYTANPESAIEHLQGWSPDAVSKRLRRDLRRAERSGLALRPVVDPAAAEALHAAYAASVRRQRGELRYRAAYFRQLIELANVTTAVQLLGAWSGQALAGFAAVARHGETSYYLHGGASEAFRHLSPSDLLLATAIRRAADGGSRRFNLMASPGDQPQLVRYKEKWGAVTRELRTHSAPIGASYPLLRAAEQTYRAIRRLRSPLRD